MHMFEACLAWLDAGGDSEWERIAAMIADLCLEKFLHPRTGALREFFDADWNPMPGEAGRVLEPGHQFEWAWLFMRWSRRTGDAKYLRAAQTPNGLRGVRVHWSRDFYRPGSKPTDDTDPTSGETA